MAPRTREPFSIASIKEVFDDCSETLLSAIKRKNPDVNPDQFDMALRQLVINFGTTNSMYPDMPGIIASIQTQTPIYSEAADLLIIARDEFKAGNTEESLKAFILSLEVPESAILFEAMAHNNEQAKAAVIDDSIDAEPNRVNNSGENEDENWEDDTPLYDITNPDEELENPDDVDTDSEDIEAKIRLIASRSHVSARHTPTDDADEDNEDNESEADQGSSDEEDTDEADTGSEDSEDDEPEDEDAPMGGTSTNVESSDRRSKAFMLRVAANKISSTGTDNALQRAKQLKRAS